MKKSEMVKKFGSIVGSMQNLFMVSNNPNYPHTGWNSETKTLFVELHVASNFHNDDHIIEECILEEFEGCDDVLIEFKNCSNRCILDVKITLK